MRNPKVVISYECEACNGTGRIPDQESRTGMTRTFVSGGSCRDCLNEPGADGEIQRRVSLQELRDMLAAVSD